MSYEFYNPTRVLFGAGQLNHLHEQKIAWKKGNACHLNGKSTRASGALDRTMKELSLAGVEVVLFDKVGANPVKEIVEEGGHFAKKEGCDFICRTGRRLRYGRGGKSWQCMRSSREISGIMWQEQPESSSR